MQNAKKSAQEQVKEFLDTRLLSHLQIGQSQPYKPKTRYLAQMIRRIIDASLDHTKLDDKDYYGNKRIELAGQLISLLFEDKFKNFMHDLKL